MPIRALVVDDEPLARDELSYLLRQEPGIEVVGEAQDGQEAIEKVTALTPDVVFMDIDLRGDNGLDLARRFLVLPSPPRVVFATAYDQYALAAFEVQALDYIVKPFTSARVADTVRRLREMAPVAEPLPVGPVRADRLQPEPRRLERLAVEEDERIVLIQPDSILFATREDRITLIRTEGRTYRSHISLQELEERLKEYPYFRPHRAYLVNAARIAEIHPWFNGAYELVMSDRDRSRIPVSRAAAKRLRELLGF